MKRMHSRRRFAGRGLALGGSVVAAGAIVVAVVAQSASGWDLSIRSTTGGGRSGGGNFVVEGSIGQPVIGRSAEGNFAVSSGLHEAGPTKFTRNLPGLAADGIPGN
jgi:hypothetical protein